MGRALLVVGGGKMGGALVAGLLAAGRINPGSVTVVEPQDARREELQAAHPGIEVVAAMSMVATEDAPAEAALDADGGAVLAVKPEQAEVVCRHLGAAGVPRLLSIVAGMATARLEACLPAGTPVVRAMPNAPALVGRGVSAIAGGAHVRAEDLDWAESLLQAVGTVVRLPERHLDAVTGLSGSGPAYVYLVAEALVEAGVLAGLTREQSEALTLGTLSGAAALWAETGERPEVLRASVTSPGGTTAAGLRALEARAVRSAFLEAVAAATERSRQLGR